jgi:adenine phosphoribosyltransferase
VDTIEIHADAVDESDNVLLIDDLIATGGTAIAAVSLLRRTGAKVEHTGFVIDLPDIGGADKLRAHGVAVEALMTFEGH